MWPWLRGTVKAQGPWLEAEALCSYGCFAVENRLSSHGAGPAAHPESTVPPEA